MNLLVDAAHYIGGMCLLHPARASLTAAALLTAGAIGLYVGWRLGGDR